MQQFQADHLCLNCAAAFLSETVADGRGLDGIEYQAQVPAGTCCGGCKIALPESDARELDVAEHLMGYRERKLWPS